MLVIIDTHKVTIGEEVTIQEQVYIGGLKTDKSVIEIGDLSMIFSGSVLNPTHPIKIGKRVGIGGYNYLFTHGTWQPILDGFPVAFGPITIEDGVWFPWRVFVLPNVHIGKEATIGAGAVVNKDVPARALAAGVPAKILRRDEEYIKKFTDAEKREILRNILVDLVGYLRIEDWTIEDPRFEERYAAAMFRTPKGPSSKVDNHILFMFDNTDDVWSLVKDRTLVVSLIALDETQRKKLEEEGSWWFDLETSEWGGLHTNVSVMMSGFLSRYGHWLKYMS
jgi:acetyltransferase-like isoleucine patch superfamily enzyme